MIATGGIKILDAAEQAEQAARAPAASGGALEDADEEFARRLQVGRATHSRSLPSALVGLLGKWDHHVTHCINEEACACYEHQRTLALCGLTCCTGLACAHVWLQAKMDAEQIAGGRAAGRGRGASGAASGTYIQVGQCSALSSACSGKGPHLLFLRLGHLLHPTWQPCLQLQCTGRWHHSIMAGQLAGALHPASANPGQASTSL